MALTVGKNKIIQTKKISLSDLATSNHIRSQNMGSNLDCMGDRPERLPVRRLDMEPYTVANGKRET